MNFKYHEAAASTISSMVKCFYNLSDYSCALACPAGGASGRA